jgi:hypothetical protein
MLNAIDDNVCTKQDLRELENSSKQSIKELEGNVNIRLKELELKIEKIKSSLSQQIARWTLGVSALSNLYYA